MTPWTLVEQFVERDIHQNIPSISSFCPIVTKWTDGTLQTTNTPLGPSDEHNAQTTENRAGLIYP